MVCSCRRGMTELSVCLSLFKLSVFKTFYGRSKGKPSPLRHCDKPDRTGATGFNSVPRQKFHDICSRGATNSVILACTVTR